MEGMKPIQDMMQIYVKKCHNENPCITIMNKQKCPFFKNEGQESKTSPVWGLIPVGRGEGIRKG
jgi:hypothetical protein